MTRYARLAEAGFDTDESELYDFGEVSRDFLDKLIVGDAATGHAAEARSQQQQKSIRDHMCGVPSTEPACNEVSCKLRNSIRHRLAQEQQNIENGNPNICLPDSTTPPTVVTICSHSSTVTGAPLQEQRQQGGRGSGGDLPSARWVGRNIEERSSKWWTVGCDSYHSDNSTGVLDNSRAASSRPSFGQWAPSIQRGTSYRDREPVVDHLSVEPFATNVPPDEKWSCTVHSSGVDGRQCQRFSKESLSRDAQFNAPIPGPEKRSLPSVMHPRSEASYGGCFTQERGPVFERSISAREAPGLQRSSSTRDTPPQRSEMSIEDWANHPAASKSSHGSDRTKDRISFSLTENHEVGTLKQREKYKEPVPSNRKVFQAKQQTSNHAPERNSAVSCYNQPGFVEREKENSFSEKAYTIHGVKEVNDCPKASTGRHHQLDRTCSLRENGSNYTKMPRSYSVNAGGRHVMPMECDTCGKGIAVMFLGLPGEEASFCKACKSSSGSARWSCGESKPPKKKKSIMDYCRNILRLPQKLR